MMAKQRMSKADKWMVDLTGLTARYGIALGEYWDGARMLDNRSGKVLGYGLMNVCGLYTAHKPSTAKRKEAGKPRPAKDVQGFVTALDDLCKTHGVQLELRSCPMMLLDLETLEPIARLVATSNGFAVEELQAV